MKYIRGYRGVALLQMLTCVGFLINPVTSVYGFWFGLINFFGAGVIFTGSALAWFNTQKVLLWTLVFTMSCLTAYNAVWFILSGVFITTGFPLIAYDLLFIITNLHFLGRGL